jgi:hypothetical protein
MAAREFLAQPSSMLRDWSLRLVSPDASFWEDDAAIFSSGLPAVGSPHSFSSDQLLSLVAASGLCWQECCGNPVLFCYRVVIGLVIPWRERQLDRGVSDLCSIPSCNYCTPSTTSKA